MSIGKNLKLFRISKNMKQKELADELGKSVQYLSAIENNKKEPSLSLLKKISSLLGIPITMFFWDDIGKTNEESPIGKLEQLLFELSKTTHVQKK